MKLSDDEVVVMLNDIEVFVGCVLTRDDVGGATEATEADTTLAPAFLPLKPHLLLTLRLEGFFSLFSVSLFSVTFSTAALLASISAFFLRTNSACSDMATSLLTLPSAPAGEALLRTHMTPC